MSEKSEIMSKKKVLSIIFVLILLTLFVLIYIRGCNGRKIILQDHRLTYSDTYRITSKSDLHTINEIITSMNPVQVDDEDTSLRIGGFVIIEEHNRDNIISYRVQGSRVTKYIYKKTPKSLISTSYFTLDDKYYQLLTDICDKHRKNK